METNKTFRSYVWATLVFQIAIIICFIIYFYSTRYIIRIAKIDDLLNIVLILMAVSLGSTIGTLIKIKRIETSHKDDLSKI